MESLKVPVMLFHWFFTHSFGLGCFLFCLFLPLFGISQPDSSGFMLNAGLNDIKASAPELLVNENVSIASLFESSIFEAPGVISVITEEDIKAGGYKDLMDLLNQIPGFSLACDVQNGISFGVRGNWAEEAKLLVMLDGMPLNELSYGTFVFGNRIDLNSVKRIEVIRGAGSSRYGGTAALGVVNVITKQGQEISGHRLSGGMGYSDNNFSRGTLSYHYGGLLPNGVEVTTQGSLIQGFMSNAHTVLPDSTPVSFGDSSNVRNSALYLTLKYKTIKFKQFYEDHLFQATYEPIFSLTRTYFTEFDKTFNLKKQDITATFNYKGQIPWNTLYGDPKIYDAQNLITDRVSMGVTVKTKYNKPFQLLFGLNAYNDRLRHQRRSIPLSSGKFREDYQGVSAFTEFFLKSRYVNLNLGVRFENYAYFEPNFAPRVSLAKKFRFWHYKVIYNQAYKLPALQNINLDVEKGIVPEIIGEIQAQAGIDLNNFDLTATYFNTTVQNLIVYGYNISSGVESYINSGGFNNHGFEVEAAWKNKYLKIGANYHFNRFLNSSAPEIMRDTANPLAGSLGLPGHKAVLKLGAILNTKVSVNLHYVFESDKESFVRTNTATDEFEQVAFPATHNVNLILNLDKFYWKETDLSLGIYNLLGTQLTYLYPFNSGYQPLIGMGREFRVNIKLKF